jgi:hypothetical protein
VLRKKMSGISAEFHLVIHRSCTYPVAAKKPNGIISSHPLIV